MPPTETYFYHNHLYTWHYEPQNIYSERHISIIDCVKVINSDEHPTKQDWYEPSRWKFVGDGRHSVITIITEDDWLTTVTAWKATRTEREDHITMQGALR